MVTVPTHIVAVLDGLADAFGSLTNVTVAPLAPRDRCYCHDLDGAPGPCAWCDGPDHDEVTP